MTLGLNWSVEEVKTALRSELYGQHSHKKSNLPRPVKPKAPSRVNARTLKLDTGGVVAYTKGSRFKDADVLAVVKRVLGQS